MFDSQTALAFANTRLDRPVGLIDSLGDSAAATTWLEEELGYTHGRELDPAEYSRLVTLRDSALRILRARLSGSAGPPTADLHVLNNAAAGAPCCEQLDDAWAASAVFTGSGTANPQNLAEALAALATAMIVLAADPSAALAECGADDCVVLFLRSDPRQRWHNERCGNRIRAARSYARNKAS